MVRVFVSYRRDDAAAAAGRLCDLLRSRLGDDNVFHDVATVRPGEDFADSIDAALTRCDAVLVVIGPHWLTSATSDGVTRLSQSNDYVREEVRQALVRSKRLIPVLVAGATMPTHDQLPDDIAALALRQATSLRDDTWRADAARLVSEVGGGFDRRVRRVLAAATVALAVGVLAILLGTQINGRDSAAPTTLAEVVTVFDPVNTVLDTCLTPLGDGWTDLGLTGTKNSDEWTFEVRGGGYRSLESGDWEVVVDIAATNLGNASMFHYPFYALVTDAERVTPQCFQEVGGSGDTAGPGETSEALVGFVVTTRPTAPLALDVTSPATKTRVNLS